MPRARTNLPCYSKKFQETKPGNKGNCVIDSLEYSNLAEPCQTYAWLVGPWEDCPNGCQAYKNRIVQCVDGFGNEKPDIMCTGTKPAYSSWCRRRNLTCSGCLYSDCLGNGLCQEGTCSCFEGWEGAHCERSRQCRGFLGYLDNNTVICCSLVDVKQRCCLSSAAVLDRDGDCCESGKLDVCGVCDGFAIMVDAESKCCTTVRDEKGLCCQSGVLDECHICDGDGTSCATNITLKLNVTSTFANMQDLSSLPSLVHSTASHIASKLNIRSEAISVTGIKVMNLAEDNCHYDTVGRNYCMQGGHFTGIVVVNITVAPIYTESIIRKMDVIDALQPGPLSLGEPLFLSEVPFRAELLHIDHVSRSGVCGNGLCERGERCNTEGNSASLNGQPCCFKDCPYVSSSCPGQTFGLVAQLSCSGNGICLDSTGQCSCFEGYAGLDCSECVLDWIPISHASCVKVPDSKTLARLALAYAGGSLHPSIPGDFAPNHSHVKLNPSYTGSKLSVGVIVGILVGSVGVMLMTILLAIFTLFPKKKSTASPSPRSTLRCIEIPETPRGPGENGTPQSKLPLWRTSFLGPQTDFGYFDIIPITPMAKRVPLNQLACIPDDENDGTTSKSTLSNPQHMSCKIASTLASDEDLTEEEQSKITTKVKKALKRGESARFVTDFLTDSESDSETLEPDSDCEPHLAFVLDVPSPATPRNCPLHVQFNP
ncbi:hypothetical protein O6H91_03G022100 [Diphasiastrum complanatum]|uniref:Uncharacterized protein n=1 Tax=Diphasiastrum complanatum TaxID=34168 RepID=A0ACC2E489_DIPCM|nr:hypothetical protein O6H91_03G022100 [Diphasiastrum complanatum]